MRFSCVLITKLLAEGFDPWRARYQNCASNFFCEYSVHAATSHCSILAASFSRCFYSVPLFSHFAHTALLHARAKKRNEMHFSLNVRERLQGSDGLHK